nr:hypothetical protein [Tanacetum cinerariifolium]
FPHEKFDLPPRLLNRLPFLECSPCANSKFSWLSTCPSFRSFILSSNALSFLTISSKCLDWLQRGVLEKWEMSHTFSPMSWSLFACFHPQPTIRLSKSLFKVSRPIGFVNTSLICPRHLPLTSARSSCRTELG